MAKSAAEKLGVREGDLLLVIGAPAGWDIGTLPTGANAAGIGAPAEGSAERRPDLALLFAPDAATLEASLDDALSSVPHDGLFWVAYRKGGAKAGTDLNRDILNVHLTGHELAGVHLIALDETWSAMRVRPAHLVGSRR